MKYLMKDVQIFEGENKLGKYYWLRATLFDDRNIRMNSERRPYYSTSNEECKIYLEAGVCEINRELSTAEVTVYDVNDSSLKEALKPGGKLEDYAEADIRHINAVKVTWPLDCVYAPIYRDDVYDKGAIIHHKGEFQRSETTGQVIEYREISFYLATDIDEDTKERRYSDDPQKVAQRILERGYKKYTGEDVSAAEQPLAPNPPEEKSKEELEKEIERLKASLS